MTFQTNKNIDQKEQGSGNTVDEVIFPSWILPGDC